MNIDAVLKKIQTAINAAPRNDYMAELHLQIIKYAENLEHITGKEFCEGVGIRPSFGTEFSKMRKIAARLRAANLQVDKI